MPMRPDLPMGLNLSRRPAAPVKLPRMNFPNPGGTMDGGTNPIEENFEPPTPIAEELPVGADSAPVAAAPVAAPTPAPVTAPAPAPAQAARVIVYGRSNSLECMDAIQDLIDRQVSFTYYDVDRDTRARQHLEAICGGEAIVPVIIYMGYRGA